MLPTGLTVLVDGSGQRALQARDDELVDCPVVVLVVVEHDDAILDDRPSPGALSTPVLRLVAASTVWDTPADDTMFMYRGSSRSTRRRPTTSSPSSACAPSTTASSTSGSGARCAMETWILASCSEHRLAILQQDAASRMFSCARSSPSARRVRSSSSMRRVRSVIDKLRPIARNSPVSSAWNPSPPGARQRPGDRRSPRSGR